MIDTVSIESPYIDEEIAQKIEKECIKREGVDMKSGEVLYRFTSEQLEGSYDSRIRIAVMRTQWRPGNEVSKVPYMVDCQPYLRVEGSIHKLLIGHNVWGGPQNFYLSVKYLVGFIESELGVCLPCVDDWKVLRVDVAEVFDLGSYEVVESYFRGLARVEFPRRQVYRYGLTGIFAPGSTTAVKFYHKGPEFFRHDNKRLCKIMKDKNKLFEIQEIANRILRVEVEVKKRKLKHDFGLVPQIVDVKDDYLNGIYQQEVGRMIREVRAEDIPEKVRNAEQVLERLNQVYGDSLSNVLFGTWSKFVAFGETYAKKTMSERTFYRHRKQLEQAGVAWHGTDMVIVDNMPHMYPENFMPVLGDARRIDIQAPEVIEKLKKVS
jgi:II/X family phage/plasmid replication protein